MKEIEELLRRTIGLDAASLGATYLQRTVRARMKAAGLKRIEEYRSLLQGSLLEWHELVEAAIITETWFFRHREAFSALSRLFVEEWLRAHPKGSARLLSVPCSSGEEAYSMAMALLDAGVPADRFRIEAVDISARMLSRAQEAVYAKNSFRGEGLSFRERYFDRVNDGFRLNRKVRDCVQFFHSNLLHDNFLSGHASYDFVFCRNLLIYFDRATQARALKQIERLLGASGILFLGPAEQPLALDHGFVSAQLPMAFACCRAGQPAPSAGRRPQPTRGLWLPGLSSELLAEARPSALRRDAQASPGAKPARAPIPDLDQARRLADAGEFDAAAALCQAHLLVNGASAQAYFLLGLVHDARGEAAALDYYRKALYLDPHHYQTLLQMAVWSQKTGDVARARTFRQRAQRLLSRAQPGPANFALEPRTRSEASHASSTKTDTVARPGVHPPLPLDPAE